MCRLRYGVVGSGVEVVVKGARMPSKGGTARIQFERTGLEHAHPGRYVPIVFLVWGSLFEVSILVP